jgi:transcriptional regulator with XRE-family HTH domain
MTIEDLAGEAKIHTTHLSGVERGKRNPGWEVVRRIAIALEVRVGDLERLGGELAEAES